MDKKLTYTATHEDDGKTVLAILRERLFLTARQIRRLKFTPGGILVERPSGEKPLQNTGVARQEEAGKQPMTTVKTVIHSGETITVFFQETEETLPTVDKELRILYEDEDLIFVDKPALLVCHPSSGHYEDTLASRLAARYHEPIRMIGRLDKDTSGVVLCARSALGAERLMRGKDTYKIQRTYVALVYGTLMGHGDITAPLQRYKCPDRWGKHGNPLSLMRTNGSMEDGLGEGPLLPAVTHYESILWKKEAAEQAQEIMEQEEGEEPISLVRIRLETGRMHQIRCHMASIGHPLVGDELYGKEGQPYRRCMLHAYSMELIHPFTGEPVFVKEDPPEDFTAVISKRKLYE